ncbi:MAG: bifunctional DNA primase/helicase [Betaproteobacteria bacterium]
MEALAENGIQLRNRTVGDHKTLCPKCSHTRKNKSDPCLSVKINDDDSILWKCHNCDWSGGAGNRRDEWKPRRIERPTKPVPILKNADVSQEWIEWFGKRSISPTTITAFNIQTVNQRFGEKLKPCAVFNYVYQGQEKNRKYRSFDKEFRQLSGADQTLYNFDNVLAHWKSTGIKEVVFVEGEMDVLAFWEAGITYATTLPNGAPAETKFYENDKRFQAISNCPEIADAEKIYIAVDADGAGQNLALELVHRFGKDRCVKVRFPEAFDVKCKDANEVLEVHGPSVLVEVLELAEPYPIEGLYRVGDYKDQVLDIYHGRVQKPLSTGFPLLDEIYKVMPGTFNLVTGVPNHGKSNFVDQLAVNLAREHGWKFAIFSPEHSTPNHIRRLAEKVAKRPFDVGPNARMSEAQLSKAMEFLHDHFYFIESNDNIPTIDWLLSKMRGAVLQHGARGVIIDPYNEIDASRDGNKREDEHIRDLISTCKQFVRRHEIALWMVAHPSKMQRGNDGSIPLPTLYDVSGSAHWNNMCDVGLVIGRDFENNQTRVVTRKIREQGLYGMIGEAFFRYNLSTHCYEEERQEIAPPVWTNRY